MLIGIAGGVLVGALEPAVAVQLKFLGAWFVAALRVLVIPVIFCTMCLGIARLGMGRQASRLGIKTVVYFEVLSLLALVFGVFAAHLLEPGSAFPLGPIETETASPLPVLDSRGRTFIDAIRASSVLQALALSIVVGLALSRFPARGAPVLAILEQVMAHVLRLVALVMRLAPLAAFGAIAYAIGHYGNASIKPLANLLVLLYATTALFVIAVLGGIARLCGVRILSLIRSIKEELLLVFGTASSIAAMPRLMEKLERMGCNKSLVSVVVPASYSFNLCGTNIYLGVAIVFLAQAYRIELDFWDYAAIVGVATLTSNGATGVAGSAFLALAATLAAVPALPASSLLLIVGIERLLKCRSLGNLIGYAVGCVAIAAWAGSLDRGATASYLDGEQAPS